ncbi:MAG: ABC transporter permease, partial [Terriglobales bacterium]
MAEDVRVERGASLRDAETGARREFGNVSLVKEVTRDTWGWRWLEDFYEDLRYGARMLRKNPGFTSVAVLMLAFGVGVNTTVFTAFDSVALKPLPVKDPANVLRLERWFASGASGDNQYAFSYPEYQYYHDQNNAFSGLIAVSWPTPVVAIPPAESAAGSNAPREPLTLQCQLVSSNYFSVLGINTAIGQAFADGESKARASNPVIVLSYPFWQRRFNSDTEISGKTLEINGTVFTIIGVTREDFIGTGNPPVVPDFWAPLEMQTQLIPRVDWLHEPSNHSLQILGRLSPGTSLGRAEAEMKVLERQFARAHPEPDETIALTLHRATYFGATDEPWFRTFAAALMAVVGLVLLVACANLANMLLARGACRRKEISTRLALGASRGRVVRQLLTESVLLAILGGSAGFLFSLWATKLEWLGLARLIHSLLGSRILVVPLTPDVREFLYTFALSLITGILFGLWPALQSSKASLIDTLKSEGSTSGQPWSRSRFRALLVGGQTAVSVVLLICAGLLLRALLRSQTTDAGFETRSVFHLTLDLGSDGAKAAIAERQLIVRLQSLPEIANVALANRIPYAGTSSRPLLIEATHASPSSVPGQSLVNYVSPSFFKALEIPIVRGRCFTPQEAEAGLPVAIVTESTARLAWPGEDPIGKRLKLDLTFHQNWKTYEVVGVAKDVRFFNLSRIDPVYV